MTITTKYKLNDEFWIMLDNKPQSFNVNKICIFVESVDIGYYQSEVQINIHYFSSDRRRSVTEDTFYATKAELLATL